MVRALCVRRDDRRRDIHVSSRQVVHAAVVVGVSDLMLILVAAVAAHEKRAPLAAAVDSGHEAVEVRKLHRVEVLVLAGD